MTRLRNVWDFTWEIVSDGFLLWCLILDAILYVADYLALSFKPSPRLYEVIFLVGVLGAAYRRDAQQRDVIAHLQTELLKERKKTEDSHITDPKEVVARLTAEGYEVKFPGVTKWLRFRREGWDDVIEEVAGKRYRIVLGDGERIHNHIMKRRRPA